MVTKIKRLPCLSLIKVLIGVMFLILSVWGVDWRVLRASVDEISVIMLIAVIATIILSLFLKIARSFLLLRNFGVQISFNRVLEAFLLGQVVNFLLPSRGGDILRVGYMSADQVSTLPQATAAVGIEKLVDLIALTVVALGVAAYLPADSASWVRDWLLPLSILGTIGLFLLILWGPGIWANLHAKLSRWPSSWFQRVLALVDRLVESCLWLRDVKRVLPAILITILIWMVMWSTNMVLFQGLNLQVPLLSGGLVLVLGYIGVLPALMPGNIGPFYFFVQLAMEPFGIMQEKGLAYTVLLHAMINLTPLIASGVSMLLSESVRKSILSLWKSR